MKITSLQKRILWLLFIVAIYLLGQTIRLPFIKSNQAIFALRRSSWIGLLGMYTGAQTQIPSLFMLGIGPYMSANIIIQAVTALDLKSLRQISTRAWGFIINFLSLIISIVQATLYAYNFRTGIISLKWGFVDINFGSTVLILTAGSMLTIFIANLNSEHGLGGSAVLIVPQLFFSLPMFLEDGWNKVKYHLSPFNCLLLVLTIVVTIKIALLVTKAEERIPIRNPLLSSDSTQSYFPIRLMLSGATPYMFSLVLFRMPQLLNRKSSSEWQTLINLLTSVNNPVGIIFYCIVIVILNYLFGFMSLQIGLRTRQLKEQGIYFYKVIPGDATAEMLIQKFNRLIWASSAILIFLGVWPLVIGLWIPEIANLALLISNLFILTTIIEAVVQQYQALSVKKQYKINLT